MKAFAQLELLASLAYSILRKDGLTNEQGHPRRLLQDYRQLRAVQLQYMNALGLSPASRSALRLNSVGDPLDLGAMISASDAEAAIDAARANGNGASCDDSAESLAGMRSDGENAPQGD